MRNTKSLIGLVLAMLLLFAQGTLAVPIFQAYIVGATPVTIGPDEDTWVTTDNPFELVVAGSYGPLTESLTEVTLLISVPKGETGTISIAGDEEPVLLTERTATSTDDFNPDIDATIDLLENETGNADGFDGYSDKEFLPADTKFNNHYPFKENVSDFLIYDLGDFDKTANAVSNYSTEDPIEYNIADGEEKTYSVLISGFSTAHFDVYGYENIDECKLFESTWSINPASHDATMVPEPATICLLGLGSTMLIRPAARARKRRNS